MATQTQTIPLSTRIREVDQPQSSRSAPLWVESGMSSSALVSSPPPLPPISRKKQATVLSSAFVTIALTIGYNQCFGVFQEYYLSPEQDILLHPSPSSLSSPPTALLAFVGTLCYGLTWAGGILVNPIISRIEHGTWDFSASGSSGVETMSPWRRTILRRLLTNRTITILGVLMISAGFALASFCTTIWQLLLTQGFLVGLGMSLLYFPLLAPAPEYFTNHRATAMGVVCFVSFSISCLPWLDSSHCENITQGTLLKHDLRS